MKKYILYLASALMLVSSCSDNEKGTPGSMDKVTDVECTPFIGSVVLSWTNPDNDNYYYTTVSYRDTRDSLINRKVSRFALGSDGRASATIGGFRDTREYDFTLVSYGYDGSVSLPVTVSCSPDDIAGAAAYVMESVTMEGTDTGAELSWVNTSEVEVWLYMSYTNEMGVTLEEKIDATTSGTYNVSDISFGTNKFTVYAENDADGSRTPSKTFEVSSVVDEGDIFEIRFDPNRTEPVNFDFAPVGLTYEAVGSSQYALMLDTSALERYIISEPLGRGLTRTDMVLSFQYRCADSFMLTLLYYPFDWNTLPDFYADKGALPKTSEWKSIQFKLSEEIERLGWGANPNSQLRFIFTTGNTENKNTQVLFEMRNIELRPGK